MVFNWKSEWIWLSENPGTKNSYIEFRRVFNVNEIKESVILNISARNEYVLYINGHYVGRGPSPCDSSWQYYDTYDITGYIHEGQNVIAAVCYHFGETDIVIAQMQGAAGFIAQMNQGRDCLLCTDTQWKCRISPRWSSKTKRISKWGGYNEIYLADGEDGWESLNYDDSTWVNADMLAVATDKNSVIPNLIPREIPFLHYEMVKPDSLVRVEYNFGTISGENNLLCVDKQADNTVINASVPGSMPSVVFDFGREVVGRPMLEVNAPQGGVLRLAYGESLELQYVDTFVLKHGSNYLKPFGRRAFRFLQVTFSATPEPVILNSIQSELVHYAYSETGLLQCSDSLLNRIWDVSRYTTLMSSHDHLEDCPWRERAMWVVDAVVMGKVIYTVFGDTALLRKCLTQGARIQNIDGSIPGTGPETNHFLLPDFCAYWVLGVIDYFNYTGDRDFVLELWPNIKKVVEWFEAQTDSTGLFSRADREGWWCFIDWSVDVDKKDKVSVISFLYYKVLKSLSQLAALFNIHEDAEDYKVRAEKLALNIREHLWIGEKRLFSDCINGTVRSCNTSMQTNFLAVWCGLMEATEANHFLDYYYKNNLLPGIKGPFFQHIVMEVLLAYGRKQEATALIKRYWGEMLKRGATTWWETFDESTPGCTIPSTYQGNTPTYLYEDPPVSHCHGWGASPAYILTNIVLGVNIFKLGEGVLILDNPDDSLEWGSGEIPSRYGKIQIDWHKQKGRIAGQISIPEGIFVIKPEGYLLDIIADGEEK